MSCCDTASYFKRAIYKHVSTAKNIRLLPEVALLIKIIMLNSNLTAAAFSLTWQPEGHRKKINKNWPHAVDEKMKST